MSKTTTSAFDPEWLGPLAEPGDDLVFVFSDFDLDVEFIDADDGFDEEAAREELLAMADEICIDKTYVDFKGTKYKNVFLREEGWNQLSQYVWKAYGGKYGPTEHIVLRRAFESMITAYMNHVAGLLGYDPEYIDFSVDPESNIKVRLIKDVAREWLTYRGPWQDWPENN